MVYEPRTSKVSVDNFQEITIDDFFDDFAWIWARDQSDRSVFDLWLHVVDHASRVARAIRLESPREVTDDLADTIVWLFSFIAYCRFSTNPAEAYFRFDNKVSELVWNKFPGYCPSCFDDWLIQQLQPESNISQISEFDARRVDLEDKVRDLARNTTAFQTCTCLARAAERKKNKVAFVYLRPQFDDLRLLYAEDLNRRKKNMVKMSDIEAMFESIYFNSIYHFSLEKIAFHMQESIGELTQALKDCYTYDFKREPYSEITARRRNQRFQERIADLISWIFTTGLKIKSIYYHDAVDYFLSITGDQRIAKLYSQAPLTLGAIIWAKYGRTKDGRHREHMLCTGCGSAPCSCQRDTKINWRTLLDASKPGEVGGH